MSFPSRVRAPVPLSDQTEEDLQRRIYSMARPCRHVEGEEDILIEMGPRQKLHIQYGRTSRQVGSRRLGRTRTTCRASTAYSISTLRPVAIVSANALHADVDRFSATLPPRGRAVVGKLQIDAIQYVRRLVVGHGVDEMEFGTKPLDLFQNFVDFLLARFFHFYFSLWDSGLGFGVGLG
jgi:hypothetical protein